MLIEQAESAQRLYFVTNTGAVFTAPQIGSSFTPWCTPHADLAPRHPAAAPHTRATERRAGHHTREPPSAALSGRSCRRHRRAGVLLLASPLVLAVGLQAPFDRGFTFPEQSCTAGVPRVTWVIAYTEHADAQSYTEDEQSRRGHYLGRGVSASVRRYTSDDGSLHITAVLSVTCVRWTARV